MNAYRSTKDIAATVRAELKKQLPEWKFSVTVHSYSGGSSITLALMQGPEQVVEAQYNHIHRFPQPGEETRFKIPYTEEKPFSGYAQLNHYQLMENREDERGLRLNNGEYLTEKGWEVMQIATRILSAEHYDYSESQADYFCTNFYRHVNIGRWNKPYQVKE